MSELRQFIFDAILLENTFDRLAESGISVRHGKKSETTARIQESDFSPRITHNAQKMSTVYEAFFCMENAVRELITERLLERKGLGWWETCVPTKIKIAVQRLKEKEDANRYYSQRSDSLIGYTMFGNLAQIIIANWEDFSDLIPDQAWLASRFNDLEMSRNIIMHTGFLPQIEIERIESIVRDWIRQVG